MMGAKVHIFPIPQKKYASNANDTKDYPYFCGLKS
jgi:hypothetical protein